MATLTFLAHLKSPSRIIIFLLIMAFLSSILVLLVFPSSQTGPFGIGLPAPMGVFVAEGGGFSMIYPKSWAPHETPQGSHGDHEVIAVITVPGRSFPQVKIARRSFENGDIEHVVRWGISRAEIYPGYTLISLDKFRTSNFDGYLHEYSWVNATLFKSIVVQCRDWLIINKTTGYSLTFCAEVKHWPQLIDVFQSMVDSLAFLDEAR